MDCFVSDLAGDEEGMAEPFRVSIGRDGVAVVAMVDGVREFVVRVEIYGKDGRR